jgi:hypothetical protein
LCKFLQAYIAAEFPQILLLLQAVAVAVGLVVVLAVCVAVKTLRVVAVH